MILQYLNGLGDTMSEIFIITFSWLFAVKSESLISKKKNHYDDCLLKVMIEIIGDVS